MLRTLTLLLLAAPLCGRAQPQLAFDTTSTENIIVYTGTVTSNGDRLLAVRGESGTVLWRSMPDGTPIYTHPPFGWATLSAMKRTDDGSFLVAMDSVVIALAENGDVEAAVAMTSHVDGDQRNRFTPFAMSATPEGAVLTGVLNYVHVDLGYTHHRPAIRTIDPYAPGCYTMPVEVNHIPVPNELYEVADLTGFEEVAVYATIADTMITSETVSTVTTTDLCNVMIAMGLGTVEPPVHQDLQTNVVQQGTPIPFMTDEARRVSVIDVAGRTLVRDQLLPLGSASLPTLGWNTGIYLLRVTDADGSAMRTHRVRVIP